MLITDPRSLSTDFRFVQGSGGPAVGPYQVVTSSPDTVAVILTNGSSSTGAANIRAGPLSSAALFWQIPQGTLPQILAFEAVGGLVSLDMYASAASGLVAVLAVQVLFQPGVSRRGVE